MTQPILATQTSTPAPDWRVFAAALRGSLLAPPASWATMAVPAAPAKGTDVDFHPELSRLGA